MSWISQSDHGYMGQPGTGYSKLFAGVRKAPNGQYELSVRHVEGSNQGYLEEHSRIERRYRADNLGELLRIGIAEIRSDPQWADDPQSISGLCAAIRDAVFEAQDKEAKDAA